MNEAACERILEHNRIYTWP